MFFWKIVLLLRKLWIRAALKTRENYNKKHKLHPHNGLAEVTGLSYQIGTIEGDIAFAILCLLGLLFSLAVPLETDNLFCVISMVLSLVAFCYCWRMRNRGTKRYQVIVYLFGGVSILLCIHIVVSVVMNTKVLIGYTNSFNALLYIWFAILMYKLLIDRKE